MQFSYENFRLLQNINDALGEIYTKGEDSIMIVRIRESLYKIITELHEQEHQNIFNQNIQNKEE